MAWTKTWVPWCAALTWQKADDDVQTAAVFSEGGVKFRQFSSVSLQWGAARIF